MSDGACRYGSLPRQSLTDGLRLTLPPAAPATLSQTGSAERTRLGGLRCLTSSSKRARLGPPDAVQLHIAQSNPAYAEVLQTAGPSLLHK